MVEVLYSIHLNNIITIPNACRWQCVIVQSTSLLKDPYEGEHAKKSPHVNGTKNFDFFVAKDSCKKNDVQ